MRTATIDRKTGETDIHLTLALDGRGKADVTTGVGFLDHMLTLFAHHGLFDLTVQAAGDLHVDAHHTVEDVAICLGQALDRALGDRAGIVRTAHSYVPMDEALGFVAVDLSGRPYAVIEVAWHTPMLGAMDTDLVRHFLETVAIHGTPEPARPRALRPQRPSPGRGAVQGAGPRAGRGDADRSAAAGGAEHEGDVDVKRDT